jgi:nitrogen regulatory protein P-II 1
MKKIDAIIRTHRFEEVVKRLKLVGVTGMTVSEVHGMSPSTSIEGVFHGQRYRIPTAPRYQLTIVVSDDFAASVVNAIAHSARTEEPGDGIVTVGDVVDVIRIRTGESGSDALCGCLSRRGARPPRQASRRSRGRRRARRERSRCR